MAANSTIYTPEVFAGMKELRGWNKQDVLEQRIQAINHQPARARISVLVGPSGGTAVDLEARFPLDDSARIGAAAEGVLIVFEKKLSTQVRAGGNKAQDAKEGEVLQAVSMPGCI